MISVGEARSALLAHARPLGTEQAPLASALRRTLRETITAPRPQPPFDASAMDGYAVRSIDTPGLLRVIGEAGAGRALSRPIGPGECARIFTGAPTPEGADAILIQEEAERDGDVVRAPRVMQGRHIRGTGSDFERGAVLLEPGRVLDGPALALAAAAGRAEVRVARRPCVAILSGGNEIVAPGATPRPHQIFDSVSFGVAGFARTWGAETRLAHPFTDDAAMIARRVEEALADADLAVIIGGASVGDHDHARRALQAIGAELLFEKAALRPGKPVWCARREGQLVLGLPGNPASAFVCARLFLRPLLDALLGRDPALSLLPQRVRLSSALPANGAHEAYLRAEVSADASGQLWAQCAGSQDSSFLSVFASTNALLIRPPSAHPGGVGDLADALYT